VPDIQPPELAQLLDFAERPRVDGWSLRAALTRYAQGQPRRVGDLLQVVRRIQYAAGLESATIERDGPALWAQLTSGTDDGAPLLGLLRAARAVDETADLVATWAADIRNAPRPDAAVDDTIASVTASLDAHGIPVEEAPGPPRGARRRG
jgi:hypothetical protein